MNGEELYARYTASLKEHWHWRGESTYTFASISTPTPNPSVPKAWAFLTKVEKDAWWSLAEGLEL